ADDMDLAGGQLPCLKRPIEILTDGHDRVGAIEHPSNRTSPAGLVTEHEDVGAAHHHDRWHAEATGDLNRRLAVGMSPVTNHDVGLEAPQHPVDRPADRPPEKRSVPRTQELRRVEVDGMANLEAV